MNPDEAQTHPGFVGILELQKVVTTLYDEARWHYRLAVDCGLSADEAVWLQRKAHAVWCDLQLLRQVQAAFGRADAKRQNLDR